VAAAGRLGDDGGSRVAGSAQNSDA